MENPCWYPPRQNRIEEGEIWPTRRVLFLKKRPHRTMLRQWTTEPRDSMQTLASHDKPWQTLLMATTSSEPLVDFSSLFATDLITALHSTIRLPTSAMAPTSRIAHSRRMLPSLFGFPQTIPLWAVWCLFFWQATCDWWFSWPPFRVWTWDVNMTSRNGYTLLGGEAESNGKV